MKILFMLCIVLSFSKLSFSQQLQKDTFNLSKSDYLLKSKRGKTTGIVFASIGVATLVTGGTIAISGASEETAAALTCIFSLGYTCPEVANAQRKQKTGGAIFFVGLGTALSSIPFFISASKNKKKANALSLRFMEPVQLDGIVYRQSHPYSIKIALAIK